MPTLLTSEADLLEQIERLEVHHLAGAGGDLTFALLLDGVDADQEIVEGDDDLLAVGGRGHRAAEPPLRPGAERRPLPPAAPPPPLQRRRKHLDGMGAQARQAARAQPASARRHRHDIRCRSPGARPRCRPACATSSRSTPTRGCRGTRRSRLIGKMAHPLNRPRFDAAEQRVVERLRHPAAARHALAADRQRGLALPARLLRPGRHRSLCGGRLRRLPGPFRRRLLHRQGHLRRRCLRGGARRARPGEHAAQPRSLRRHLRARRPRLRCRGRRGVSVPLRCRRQAPASLDARRLAAPAVDPRPPARTFGDTGGGSLEDARQPAPLAARAAHAAVARPLLVAADAGRRYRVRSGDRGHRDPGLPADRSSRSCRAAPAFACAAISARSRSDAAAGRDADRSLGRLPRPTRAGAWATPSSAPWRGSS